MFTCKRLLLVLALLVTAPVSAVTIEMEVNGLVCAFCAQGIEKALQALPGTGEVLVSLEHRLVAVALDEGAELDDATLRTAMTEAGYTVVAIERGDTSIAALRARIESERNDD